MRAAAHNQTHEINWSASNTQAGNRSTTPARKGFTVVQSHSPTAIGTAALAAVLSSSLQKAAKAAIATLAMSAILLAAAWVSEALASSGVAQAMIWASSFVFLALAVDSSYPRSLPLLGTGAVLGVLALLGSPDHPEFTILAAAVIAAWIAWTILRGGKL
jgi:hypothetical protein